MPEISRFYGTVIKMFFDDHTPPHFHAQYSEHEALIAIRTLAVISGRLPARALGLVAQWALLHQDELLSLWAKAKTLERLTGVPPRFVLVDSGLGVPRRRDGLLVGDDRLTRAQCGTGQGGDRLREFTAGG